MYSIGVTVSSNDICCTLSKQESLVSATTVYACYRSIKRLRSRYIDGIASIEAAALQSKTRFPDGLLSWDWMHGDCDRPERRINPNVVIARRPVEIHPSLRNAGDTNATHTKSSRVNLVGVQWTYKVRI